MKRMWQLTVGLMAAGACLGRAAVIANWTFETSQPVGTGTSISGIYAEGGILSGSASQASGVHASSSSWSSPSGDASAHSFSANTWATGDYYQLATSTLGYSGIVITFEQTSSGSGPTSFKIVYSMDGANFNDFSAYTVGTTSWGGSGSILGTKLNFDFSSITTLDNQSTVYFRLVDTSATGNSVGTSRVDDFMISATPIPEPGACGAIAAAGLLAFCSFESWRQRRISRKTRTSQAKNTIDLSRAPK